MKTAHGKKSLISKLLFAVIVPVIVTVVLYPLETSRIFLRFEDFFYSLRFERRGSWKPDNPAVAIVGITSQALDEMGEYGRWMRSDHAMLINRLVEAGARLIIFDILFLTEGKYGPEDDQELATAIQNAKGKVILACEHVEEPTGHGLKIFMALPYQKFIDANAELGAVNLKPDEMGYINNYVPYFISGEKLYLTLGLKAALKYMGMDPSPDDIYIRNDTLHIKNMRIPLVPGRYQIPINHMGPAQSIRPFVSYEQFFNDEDFQILLDKGTLKNKLVFVGATAPDLQDIHRTAFSAFGHGGTPGVEIHAQLAESVLNQKFLFFTPGYITFGLLLLCSGMASFVTFRFGLTRATGLLTVIVALHVILGLVIFIYNSIVIPIFTPILAICATYVTDSLYFYLKERKAKKEIRGYFQHYVTKSLVDELIKNPELVKLGGERRVMSVLFSDIAGFTTISESMDVGELVLFLNEYLTEMTNIVLGYDGYLDKYEGDAIMAEFGAPIPKDDHALRACKVAIDMQTRLAELREKWKSEGKPVIKVRIGINTGEMLVGNMGSHDRFDYTVIGDHVNLASRLEGANKQYQTYMMISEFTYDQVKTHVLARELDLIRVKGKKQAVRIYELISLLHDPMVPQKKILVDCFHRGLEAYQNQNWDEAEKQFREALKLDQNDGPSRIYLDRCRMFRMSPPPPDWDGVFTMKTK